MTSSPFQESTRHYAELVEQSQLAMLNAVESWTRAARDAAKQFGGATATTPSFVAEGLVDQIYDFAAQMLEVQRGISKQLLNTALASARDAAQQTRRA